MFKKAVYLSQEIASLGSEGGMKTFTERYTVLKDILIFWKLGKNTKVLFSGEDLAKGDSKNLITESECQEQEMKLRKLTLTKRFYKREPQNQLLQIKASSISNKIL